MQRFLAGDIGGTKVIMAIYEVGHDGTMCVIAEKTYVSAEHETFTAIIRDFRQAHPDPVHATGLGVAGPVFDRRCQATNLPWIIDARELEGAMPIGRVALVNDFKAAALGVLHLQPHEWVELNAGKADPTGSIAVLGAGTGLGEALLFHDGARHHVVPTEGGHTDFAPRNEVEIGLLRFMIKRHKRVSYERILSGAGIRAIYDYLVDSGETPNAEVGAAFATEDDAAVISRHAAAGTCAVCEQVLTIFCGIYGAEAGNLALQIIATGGVYVTGGIGPKNLAKLQDGTFRDAYVDKGRFSGLVASIPVRLVMNPQVGLLGAAAAAVALERQGG